MKKRLLVHVIAMLVTLAAAMQVHAESVTLKVDTKGQEIDGVRIYGKALPDIINSRMDAPVYDGNDTTITLNDIEPGKTYRFAAVVYRGDDRSDISNVVEQQIPIIIKLTAPGLAIIKVE